MKTWVNMNKKTSIDWEKPKYPPTVHLEKVGDIIEGVVIRIGEVILEDRAVGFLHIKTLKEEVTLWLGKVLAEEVPKAGVKEGDYIGIKYLGEKPSNKQTPYKNYDMRVIPIEEESIDTGVS